MPIPAEVQTLLDQALMAVRAHPHHELDWHLRERLYAAFGSIDDPQIKLNRGRLAVLAAQHVHPIFQAAYPDDDFPQQLIEVAVGWLNGTVNVEDSAELQDTADHTFGNEIYEAISANTAGFSAYKALLEVQGWANPFENAAKFHKKDPGAEWVDGKSWTDADWSQMAGAGDTAAAAAIAFAYDEDELGIDPKKLLVFWEWWLTEAIPAAWTPDIPIAVAQSSPQEQDAQGYFEAALKHDKNASYKKALQEFDKAIELAPHRAEYYLRRGRTRWNTHDQEGALADLNETLAQTPDSWEAYLYRGDVYRSARDFQNAIDDYTQAIRLNPGADVAYEWRAWVRFERGDKTGALKDISHAIELAPDRSIRYNTRGRFHLALGNTHDAVLDYLRYAESGAMLRFLGIEKVLDEIIRDDPQFAEAYLLRGLTGSWLKSPDQVLADMSEMIRLKPEDVRGYLHRGFVSISIARSANDDAVSNSPRLDPQVVIDLLQRGVADLTEVVRRDPGCADAYIVRGTGRYRLQDKEGGLTDIRKGFELRPDHPDAKILRRIYKLGNAPLSSEETDLD